LRLDRAGLIVRHYLTLTVSRRMVAVLGAGLVKRQCSRSGRSPGGSMGCTPV